jgi:acyl carrier protein
MATDQHTHIIETVTRYVHEELLVRRPGLEVDADTDLIANGVVDSMGLLRLVAFLEDTFDFTIPPSEILPGNLGSIDAIGRYVTDRLKQG